VAEVTSMPPAAAPLLLVLPNGARLPLQDIVTIGRGDGVTVKLDDRTVSRLHCRITTGPQGPVIEDAGSRFGVIVSGQALSGPRPLVTGSEIKLGNVVLRVESEMPAPAPGGSAGPDAGPNATIVVPVGATQMGLRAGGANATDGALRPRLRSGWALKRLDDDRAEKPYVLRDLKEGGGYLRMDESDAQLLELLDGRRTITELLTEATARLGSAGAGRLARLVADFGERGLLDGIAPTPQVASEPGVLARAFKPREKTFGGLGDYFINAYRHWGRIFFSPLTVSMLALLSLAGIVVFA
jgi:putative peptide zinc metalloprotease protein